MNYSKVSSCFLVVFATYFVSQSLSVNIGGIDLKLSENAKAHHTDRFHASKKYLIVRRGDSFKFQVNLADPKDSIQNYQVELELEFVSKVVPAVNSTSNETVIRLPVDEVHSVFEANTTNAYTIKSNGPVATIGIHLPADSAIGSWNLTVILTNRDTNETASLTADNSIVVLFNAWSKDDRVYMENDEWKAEYVLNDMGKVYQGSSDYHMGKAWAFGQFEPDVLDSVLFILDRANMTYQARRDVIKVARFCSYMMSAEVLKGNWDGDWYDGVSPMAWTGSTGILQRYYRSGGEMVKYGQCWVFAGTLTATWRVLGIPGRPISAFSVPIDSDRSLSIDHFFDRRGRRLKLNDDSIWNFHVWTEAWFSRPELQPGFGGWQAIDGVGLIGPASVFGVKNGEIQYDYDMQHLFTEVNADVISWVQDENSLLGWKRTQTDRFEVAPLILTKQVGYLDIYSSDKLNDADDVTRHYKYEDGSSEEKMALIRAAKVTDLSVLIEVDEQAKTIDFELLKSENVMIGNEVTFSVKVTNLKSTRTVVDVMFELNSVYYNGVVHQNVHHSVKKVILASNQTQVVKVTVDSDDYMSKLVGLGHLKLYVTGIESTSGYMWSDQSDYVFEKPQLVIKSEAGELKVGKPFTVRVTLVNPLNVRLTRAYFSYESIGLAEFTKRKLNDVEAKGVIEEKLTFVPDKSGVFTININFGSRQLTSISGNTVVDVFP